MKMRLVLRILVGLIMAVAAFAIGADTIGQALKAEPTDWTRFCRGAGIVVLGVLMLVALVVSHRARQRIAERQRRRRETSEDLGVRT